MCLSSFISISLSLSLPFFFSLLLFFLFLFCLLLFPVLSSLSLFLCLCVCVSPLSLSLSLSPVSFSLLSSPLLPSSPLSPFPPSSSLFFPPPPLPSPLSCTAFLVPCSCLYWSLKVSSTTLFRQLLLSSTTSEINTGWQLQGCTRSSTHIWSPTFPWQSVFAAMHSDAETKATHQKCP